VENIDFDRSVISLLVDVKNMKRAQKLGLRKHHIVGINEQDIYQFSTWYWINSGREKTASEDVIFEEFKYVIRPIDETIEYVVSKLLERYGRNFINDSLMSVVSINGDDSELPLERCLMTVPES